MNAPPIAGAPPPSSSPPTAAPAEKPTAQTATSLEWVMEGIGEHNKKYQSPDEYFFAFLRDLRSLGVDNLEKNRNVLKDAEETVLTLFLISPLMAIYDLSTETNSNGHPDIHLSGRWPGIAWKAEAKIAKTLPWYCEGLVKLVEKFNSGKENDTLMVGYCRSADLAEEKAEYMQHVESKAVANFTKWHTPHTGPKGPDAVSLHLSNGSPIRVHHLWANCFYETDDKLFTRKPEGLKLKEAKPLPKKSSAKGSPKPAAKAPRKAAPPKKPAKKAS